MRDKTKRLNWSRFPFSAPKLSLTDVQRESWDQFLKEGIGESLREISPIQDFTGKNWSLEFGEYEVGEPSLSCEEARQKGLTYAAPLKVQTTLVSKQTTRSVTQEVFLGDVPLLTPEATFVINGIDRVVVNQIVRSPGVYFFQEQDVASGRMLSQAEIRPLRGAWLELEINRHDVMVVRVDRRRKFPVTLFLRALGLSSDEEIRKALAYFDTDRDHKYLTATLEKDSTRSQAEAYLEIYRRLRSGEPVVLETAANLFESMFFDRRRYDFGRVGRFKLNKKLGLDMPNISENWVLKREDFVAVVAYLMQLQNKGEGKKVDDIDHLANRRVRRVGELVQTTALRVGLLRLERAIKEKMSLVSAEERPTPQKLVNARPVVAVINEFFRSNQLSAILDQTNPLSEIDNLRRLSVLGAGGISRERASFSIRDIGASQYSRVCPVRAPEGPNIGLVTYLSLFTRVNDYGFLEAPYREVKQVKVGGKARMQATEKIVYLTADDEEKFVITHAGVKLDEKGFIEEKWVPMRSGGDFGEGPVERVELMDMVPWQSVGTSAALIPFLAHDEANRALMGTNMQCQAVPLLNPEAPVVGTGMEEEVAVSMNRVVKARHSGKVVWADAEKVVVRLDKKPKEGEQSTDFVKLSGSEESYFLMKFRRTAQSTCYNQRPVVKVGDKVKEGDLIIDGAACEDGELALGRNLVIAYTSFEGLGYEDAIVVSDRLVKEDLLTSVHIEEYEATVVETKLGPEELTRDIPNVSESDLANLAEDGIVVVGAKVEQGDILVGKIAPKGETELTAEERLLRAIFGEKAREVRDTSLRMPHGERGVVIGVRILDREKGDDLEPGALKKVIVQVAQIRQVSVGDKVAGRHGNKGVISKVVPVEDMPYLPNGEVVDIVISPLSVLARMNLGQLLEAHLGWALAAKKQKAAVPAFDVFDEDKVLADELSSAGLPVSGKIRLRDGRTGEEFKEESVVGVAYILKLIHMVEDKTHARSTGPYSLVTQQPLGGKAQMGGQRLGEMEVWALEAHRAAHTLQEMLTIKSDDIVGRSKAFEAIIKGVPIPEATVPESFKVLMLELKSLGLAVNPKGEVVRVSDEERGGEGGKEELVLTNEAEAAEAGITLKERNKEEKSEEVVVEKEELAAE